jgi:HSP20 family protein
MAGRDRLHEEIEELFAELWQVPRFAGLRHAFRPNVDCFHTDDPHVLTVVVELPGIEPGSLQLVAADRLLVIAGERKRPQVKERVYQQMEIDYGPFRRQIRLAEEVDPARARATYEQGILTVQLPVVERRTPPGRVTIVVSGE